MLASSAKALAIAAAAPPRPARRPGWLCAATFWIRRYLAQDLIGKFAALAWAAVMLPAETTAGVGAGSCAMVEIAAFYAVVWWRARRGRPWRAKTRLALCAAIAREYGPAELVDFVARPAAMGVGFATGVDPIAAVLLGSLLADLAFYGTAIVACRRGGIAADRGEITARVRGS